MRYLQLLCLAFALTTLSASMVVYGQLANAHKDSCLIISFQDLSVANERASAKKQAQKYTHRLQNLLNASNVPLEISYIIASAQYSVPENFLGLLKHKPAFKAPQLAPPKPVEEQVKVLSDASQTPEVNISANVYQAELSGGAKEAEVQTDTLETTEKPVLRAPVQ
jgi:hypothetical protein